MPNLPRTSPCRTRRGGQRSRWSSSSLTVAPRRTRWRRFGRTRVLLHKVAAPRSPGVAGGIWVVSGFADVFASRRLRKSGVATFGLMLKLHLAQALLGALNDRIEAILTVVGVVEDVRELLDQVPHPGLLRHVTRMVNRQRCIERRRQKIPSVVLGHALGDAVVDFLAGLLLRGLQQPRVEPAVFRAEELAAGPNDGSDLGDHLGLAQDRAKHNFLRGDGVRRCFDGRGARTRHSQIVTEDITPAKTRPGTAIPGCHRLPKLACPKAAQGARS